MKRKKFKKISKNIYEIENALPEKVAEKIFSEFKKNDSKSWKLITQKKTKHYSHVFKNNSEFLPDENEVYSAKFYRSDKLKNNPYIKLSIQKFILPLFKKYASEKDYEYAEKHREIIARFGRFPHRNVILGRKSTNEELEFLKQPGSSF